MHRDLLPPIDIEIGYKDKTSGEISVVNDSITPLKRFPEGQFEKLYEIGTVKVSPQSLPTDHFCNFIRHENYLSFAILSISIGY